VTGASSADYWCELALVDGRPQPSVAIEVIDGRFSSITVGADPIVDAVRLTGFTIPGLANAHSHAFHRALRARTQSDRGTFWTWRELMYRAAERLQPDSYHRLARATFAEMALAGVTCVGEFHYVHHQPAGTPYADPNEMGEALMSAAAEAGIRITLLDTLYLHGGLTGAGYSEPEIAQRRFSDGTVGAWIERVAALGATDRRRIGAAIHSVRAVDPGAMGTIARWAADTGSTLHAHVSEQPSENEACLARHGRTPTGLLEEAGVLSTRFTAVHATHLVDADIAALAAARSTVAMCPTTERDLGDGIGPTRALAAAGVPMALGSDSHAVIDLFEEGRALELDERLRSQQRGVHGAIDLLAMATVGGHRCLGWDDAGAISIGHRADLVSVSLGSVRTAGARAADAIEAVVFAASASDVTDVVVDGRRIVTAGRHVDVDVAGELHLAIAELMGR
jgi:formiminoglutamate deiminase